MTLPLKHIIQVMNTIHVMPPELRLALHETPERIELPKNHMLVKPGEICDYLYYIEKGILCCTEADRGKSYCTWIMVAGDIATSVQSFNTRIPATDCIETLTDCVLHTLSWDQLEQLTDRYREFSAIRQRLTDKYHLQARTMDAQRKRDPEQFLEFLKKEYKENLDLIPQKILASYMGISEVTLYRIKKYHS